LEYTDIRQLYLTKKEEGKQAEVKKLIDSYTAWKSLAPSDPISSGRCMIK
jgi:hypothetical protein